MKFYSFIICTVDYNNYTNLQNPCGTDSTGAVLNMQVQTLV